MRSSGHESFCCRYTWLPKAFAGLSKSPALFSDETDAMVRLGLGKNMVRSLRFWVQAFGIAEHSDRGLVPTDLGRHIFDEAVGRDPYLENTQTLWLLHWNLSIQHNPLLAWDELLFRWPSGEFTRSEVIPRLAERANENNLRASERTLHQHFDIFLSTYLAKKDEKKDVLEDNLDCPLAELGLIGQIGYKTLLSGPREPVFAFRHEPKPDISSHLFSYCLDQFWTEYHAHEQTLSLQQISSGPRSPGRVFRLPEADIRTRLERLEQDTNGHFNYVESVSIQQVRRSTRTGAHKELLALMYREPSARA
jgi:hypothetical protein